MSWHSSRCWLAPAACERRDCDRRRSRCGRSITGDASSEGLRLRRCCDPTCNTLFAICTRCDRGQRYCSQPCRARMPQLQQRAAGRRYQASCAGKEAYRRRQREYRHRHHSERVTHQGTISITSSQSEQPRSLSRCLICGSQSQWTIPLAAYALPQRGRHQRRLHQMPKRCSDFDVSDDRQTLPIYRRCFATARDTRSIIGRMW